MSPPFEPAAELPDILREARRVHRAPHFDDEGMIAEFGAEFPGLTGAVIFRDSEDSDRILSLIADLPWPEWVVQALTGLSKTPVVSKQLLIADT